MRTLFLCHDSTKQAIVVGLCKSRTAQCQATTWLVNHWPSSKSTKPLAGKRQLSQDTTSTQCVKENTSVYFLRRNIARPFQTCDKKFCAAPPSNFLPNVFAVFLNLLACFKATEKYSFHVYTHYSIPGFYVHLGYRFYRIYTGVIHHNI